MKKLMIATAIVCAAVVTHAATVNWSQGECTAYPGETDYPAAGTTVYLIQSAGAASIHTQSAFIEMLAAASGDFSGITTTIESWKVTKTTTNDAYGDFEVVGGTADVTGGSGAKAYYAIIDATNERVFMSTDVGAMYSALGEVYTFAFGEDDYDASVGALKDSAEGFAGAGWYKSAAAPAPGPTPIPEPTSGLLMLLGVAGLALRRRRA